MQQYNVTGMSCAACSSRVEKAVKKVPGVTACSVSLLTNSMGVEGMADEAEVIQAVENAGYGAAVKGREKSGKEDGNPGHYHDRRLCKGRDDGLQGACLRERQKE